jgi:hypothetical protein
MTLPIVSIIVAVLLLALALWALRTLAPTIGLPAPVVTVLYVLVVCLFVLWLLGALGLLSGGMVRVG